MVANGWSPPDIGVAAAYAASAANSAVIYTEPDTLNEHAAAVLSDYRVSRVVIIGGTAAVVDTVRAAIGVAASDATVQRITGTTRAHTAAAAARRILRDN